MENTTDTKKNVTMSFKTTTDEKTALQQIANEKQISRSELLASIVHAYKHSYDYIGKTSPKEEELKSQLKTVEKQNRKLNLSLENAEHRIEMEQKTNRNYVKEQLEMNKTIFDLHEELKTANMEISRLMITLNANESIEQGNYDSRLLYGSLGSLVLSGLTLLFMPKLFNN
ncbi:hypothetical protein [Psychroserpens ponticola]|uniref:Ribbon-helix-helix protein, CopG family n=1 Tax=Psychroserpens ponticola TaxID=2932268 RepID=A0ABY7RXC7_9FLAO|nr:hypothetical protein [Psychroserpens ponticola]WCO01326.1 hypothetical protein MUN68_014810 [Psychroserpens ponticola]